MLTLASRIWFVFPFRGGSGDWTSSPCPVKTIICPGRIRCFICLIGRLLSAALTRWFSPTRRDSSRPSRPLRPASGGHPRLQPGHRNALGYSCNHPTHHFGELAVGCFAREFAHFLPADRAGFLPLSLWCKKASHAQISLAYGVALAGLGPVFGCGGGGSSGGGVSPPPQVPATVTITATAGNLTQTTSLLLTVN